MTGKSMGKVIMVMGTSSHAGKSVLASALCRIFVQDGLRVAPFKSQNMSLNSYATPDGGEIGRAQAVQAEAARVMPEVEMNPILLKPEGERRSQVVVLGRPTQTASAREYYKMKQDLWPVVTRALDHLRSSYDMVVIEGAGSPAEINLSEHEIVNMRVARYAEAPVLLVGDIDRGGVFAHLVGTMALLKPEEQALVKGFVINKFRGDPSLLDSGLEMLRERTGVSVAGVLPYFTHIHIPEEDSLGLDPQPSSDGEPLLDIAVIRLPHIANFDDFDPLRREPGVSVRYVSNTADLDSPDLILIPGTKTTVADLDWLRQQGLADAIVARRKTGTPIVGICGGYQMLGDWILDPERVESEHVEVRGLALLPVTTVFEGEKTTHQVMAKVVAGDGLLAECTGAEIKGYEIHSGSARGETAPGPFRITQRSGRASDDSDGVMDSEGRTLGTYMHGLFHNRDLRRGLLARLAGWKGVSLPPPTVDVDPDAEYDKLADFVREHLDMELVYRVTGIKG
jgi:adenosylcobyric acid synthase